MTTITKMKYSLIDALYTNKEGLSCVQQSVLVMFAIRSHNLMGRGGVEVSLYSVPCSRRVAGSNPPQGVYLVPCSRRVAGSNPPQVAA